MGDGVGYGRKGRSRRGRKEEGGEGVGYGRKERSRWGRKEEGGEGVGYRRKERTRWGRRSLPFKLVPQFHYESPLFKKQALCKYF